MTPQETLRTAAKTIRERAEAATFGPWECLENGDRIIGVSDSGIDWIHVVDEPMSDPANAEHIVTWHPGVARAMAELFDHMAFYMDTWGAHEETFPDHVPEWRDMVADRDHDGRFDWTVALRAARLILDEVPGEVTP